MNQVQCDICHGPNVKNIVSIFLLNRFKMEVVDTNVLENMYHYSHCDWLAYYTCSGWKKLVNLPITVIKLMRTFNKLKKCFFNEEKIDINSPEYRDLVRDLTTTKINLPPLQIQQHPIIPTSPLPILSETNFLNLPKDVKRLVIYEFIGT